MGQVEHPFAGDFLTQKDGANSRNGRTDVQWSMKSFLQRLTGWILWPTATRQSVMGAVASGQLEVGRQRIRHEYHPNPCSCADSMASCATVIFHFWWLCFLKTYKTLFNLSVNHLSSYEPQNPKTFKTPAMPGIYYQKTAKHPATKLDQWAADCPLDFHLFGWNLNFCAQNILNLFRSFHFV